MTRENSCYSFQFSWAFQVSAGQTVQGLKEILAMQISIPVEEQKLVFKGKALAGKRGVQHQGEGLHPQPLPPLLK